MSSVGFLVRSAAGASAWLGCAVGNRFNTNKCLLYAMNTLSERADALQPSLLVLLLPLIDQELARTAQEPRAAVQPVANLLMAMGRLLAMHGGDATGCGLWSMITRN